MIAQLACLLILRSSIAADSEQRRRFSPRPPGNWLKAPACLLDLVKKMRFLPLVAGIALFEGGAVFNHAGKHVSIVAVRYASDLNDHLSAWGRRRSERSNE